MPVRETYLLHLYRSRTVSGWQWTAQLAHLPGGETLRFGDPEDLLAHLRTVWGAVERPAPPLLTGAEDTATTGEADATNREG